MLGLVGERILAVEEDLASLVLCCDDRPVVETKFTNTSSLRGSDDANNTNNADNATTVAENGNSGLLLESNKNDEARGESSTVAPSVSAIAAATCAGLQLPFVRYTAHFSAWITQGVVFVVLIAHFFTSQHTCEFADAPGGREDNVAPDFVYAIVFCELGLFACFGLTQLVQFVVGVIISFPRLFYD